MPGSRIQNKVLQMLYKPGKKKKSASPKKAFEDMEKALEKGIGAISGKKSEKEDKDDD